MKPEALVRLLDSLESNPELHLAVGLVALYGLRPAELMVLSYEDGKLKVGNKEAKQQNSGNTQKAPHCSCPQPERATRGR